jgi:UDP-2,4-diacetamido-2,4,6-trideoxy-beta-L-altropyranose hydrolase
MTFMVPDTKRVFFRVDESAEIGRGHMSRCYALAIALMSADAKVYFFSKEILPKTKLALTHVGINSIKLKDEKSFLNQDMTDVIVVVDGYHFEADFWEELMFSTPRLTVCIDDYRRVKYLADIVICYNEGVTSEQFELAPNSRLFLGGRYLLLRPDILTAASLPPRPFPRRALMIASGGSRQELWVAKMLSHISRINPKAPLWVLSGRRLSVRKILYTSGLCRSRLRFFSDIDAVSMIHRYRQASCLFTPASTMMLEAFAAGCPLVSVSIADNQRNSLSHYDARGLIVNASGLRKISFSSLAVAYNKARRQPGLMVRRQLSYIRDSKSGVHEIVKTILATT